MRCDTVPEPLSPLLQLWYLTNATARKRRNPGHVEPVLGRHSLFFPLACFKHSLLTWLAQAGGLDIGGHNNNNNNNYISSYSTENDCISTNICNSNNWPVSTMSQEAGVGIDSLVEACDQLLEESMSNPASLPGCVTEVLTKLFLALPDFVERTLYTQHLTLHRGSPITLAHTWDVSIQPQLRLRKFPKTFKPQYSLEILFGQGMVAESSFCLNAMLILFAAKECVLWIGTVTPFPACKHCKTMTLKTLDVDSSISLVREDLSDISLVFNMVSGVETVSHWWMLQKMFPGVCHMIQGQERQNAADLLDSCVELLAGNIQSLMSKCLSNQSTGTLKICFHSKLRSILETLGLHFSLFPPEKDFNEGYTIPQCFPLDDIHCNTVTPVSGHLAHCIRSGLFKEFSKEIHFFIGNRKTHILFCRSCSQLWFPKPATLDRCIAQCLRSPQLPFSVWPFHLVVDALEMTVNALEKFKELTV